MDSPSHKLAISLEATLGFLDCGWRVHFQGRFLELLGTQRFNLELVWSTTKQTLMSVKPGIYIDLRSAVPQLEHRITPVDLGVAVDSAIRKSRFAGLA